MKNIKRIIPVLALLIVTTGFAQFDGRAGKNLKECDCNKMLDSLNVTFKVPANVAAFDIIGFRMMLDGGRVSYASYYANRLKAGEEISFNLLSPRTKGVQFFPGIESGKFQGTDMHTSYESLCQKNGTAKLKGEVIGIKMVGTETEYKYNSGTGIITANTRRLYDGGTNIGNTTEVNIKQQTRVRGKLLPIAGALVAVLAGICGYGTSVILNPKN